MRLEEHYREGLRDGAATAEDDLVNHVPVDAAADEALQEARLAVRIAHTQAGRAEAAYRLGFARAYREVTREAY